VRRLPTRLPGLVLVEPLVHRDDRGFFLETYRADRLAELGVSEEWVQDNQSRSTRGVARGLHVQLGGGQAKLVRCARGAVWDVAVDIRHGSPTYGQWESFRLDDASSHLLYVPIGFAHGFCTLSEEADVVYRCSAYYDLALEVAIALDDPDLGIEWPLGETVRSDRDRRAPRLREVSDRLPFRYG
jgi:dTDP-4-dehydrorhamnose 3,5-epimerase